MLGFSTTVFYNFYCEMLRAVGNSRTPMLFLLLVSVLHILLAVLLQAKWNLGVLGAALATVISQAVAVALCVGYARRKVPCFRIRRADWRLDGAMLKECLHIGVPTMMTNFIIAFGTIILQFVTNGIGTEYVTAYTCASRIGYILTTPITGYAVALAVFVAQNCGAGNLPRIRSGIRKTGILLLLCNIVLWAISQFAARPLLALMITDNAQAVEAGVMYLRVRSLAMFILPVGCCCKSVLNALGKPLFPTLSGILEIAVRYAAPLVLVAHGAGFLSVPLTDAAAWTAIAVFLALAYLIEMQKIEKMDFHEKQHV